MALGLFGSFTPNLQELQRRIDSCRLCPYGNMRINSGARTKSIGCTSSGLMVIGQCPGRAEVTSGYAYSGASGSLFKTIICSVLGMNELQMKSTVRMTNVLRCMTPDGKAIVNRHVRTCMQWLDDEVYLVRPKAILCLGTVAGNTVMPGCEFSMVCSTIYDTPGIKTYHPAYLLRVKSDDKAAYNDLYERVFDDVKTICSYISVPALSKAH